MRIKTSHFFLKIYFKQLRGLSSRNAKANSTRLLEQLKLTPKTNEFAKHLSGGMKRRLSLGIALIGDTK